MSWEGRLSLVIPQALTVDGSISRRGHFFYSSLSIRATDSLSSSRVPHFAISSRIALKRCLSEAKFFSSIPFYLPNFQFFGFSTPKAVSPFRCLLRNFKATATSPEAIWEASPDNYAEIINRQTDI